MGKTSNWFAAVKKALSPESATKKEQKNGKRKKKWGFRRSKHLEPYSSSRDAVTEPPASLDVSRLTEAGSDQTKHAYSVALATAAAAEAAAAAAQAAAEVVRLTSSAATMPDVSKEEVAATKIQAAFRGYLARKELQALRGLCRLKKLINGNSVKRQTATALHCMQTLARVQSQILSRRVKMAEENMALRKQLQLKHEQELENLKLGEEWDDSLQSKEQIETHIQHRHDAAVRRERALAYAFSHQQRKNLNHAMHPLFTDISNPQWGWSWLERWMATKSWETRTAVENDLSDSLSSFRSLAGGTVGDNTNTSRHNSIDKTPSRTVKTRYHENCQSPSTPPSKCSTTGKCKLASPGSRKILAEDDARSTTSLRSERCRRHSIAGSVLRDDESLASSSSVPSYMVSTESARAKSRLPSPSRNKIEKGDQGSSMSVKKRLSFPPSPTVARRSSIVPKMELTSAKNGGTPLNSEEKRID